MPTFRKQERLSGKKKIEELMEKGNSFSKFPFRVVWKEADNGVSPRAQIAISVSKRNFKKAVDRNRIKRQIREAYRTGKQPLYEHLEAKNKKIIFMVIYTK